MIKIITKRNSIDPKFDEVYKDFISTFLEPKFSKVEIDDLLSELEILYNMKNQKEAKLRYENLKKKYGNSAFLTVGFISSIQKT